MPVSQKLDLHSDCWPNVGTGKKLSLDNMNTALKATGNKLEKIHPIS